MVDFSQALKERIDSMSPDELAATEVRRLAREAERGSDLSLEAVWEPESKGPPVTKTVNVQIDPGTDPESPEVLRISQGTSFHESIILLPAIYRLLAGGRDDPAPVPSAPAMEGTPVPFIINAGGAGYDKVSVDCTALAAIMTRERPGAMALARHLVDLDARAPAHTREAIEKQRALFEQRWDANAIHAKIDAAVSQAPSRALNLIAGKDSLALWVRKDDLTLAPERILTSPLAPAIVRPDQKEARQETAVPDATSNAGSHYIQNTFGSGPERRMVLDVARLRKIVVALSKDERARALTLIQTLIERSAAVAMERAARTRSGQVVRPFGQGHAPL